MQTQNNMLSPSQFYSLWDAWRIEPKSQRFGQYVMNQTDAIPRDDCIIWEEKNPWNAYDMISARFVDWSQD